jgi:hypothetical protein
MTHIEVTNAKGHQFFQDGQLLQVIRQTACFIWVKSHSGAEFQVSKKTKRINGTATSFIRTSRQPQTNF